ncbi:MAG: DUF2059 domain-containing protein [Minwuia sp.]|uniref:DUF2059 domain-containing protein n=1 Tax=Minwuia sp. TaxID=2493630 RepID=UPI003A877355
MRRLLITLALLAAGLMPASAAEPSSEQVMEMFRVTGVEGNTSAVMEQMRPIVMGQLVPALRAAATERQLAVPDNFNEIVGEEFDRSFGSLGREIMVELAPLFQQAFTAEEMQAVIDFYDTDLGRRLVETSAKIVPVTSRVGQVLGAEKGQELAFNVLNRLKKDGEVEN